MIVVVKWNFWVCFLYFLLDYFYWCNWNVKVVGGQEVIFFDIGLYFFIRVVQVVCFVIVFVFLCYVEKQVCIWIVFFNVVDDYFGIGYCFGYDGCGILCKFLGKFLNEYYVLGVGFQFFLGCFLFGMQFECRIVDCY